MTADPLRDRQPGRPTLAERFGFAAPEPGPPQPPAPEPPPPGVSLLDLALTGRPRPGDPPPEPAPPPSPPSIPAGPHGTAPGGGDWLRRAAQRARRRHS